MSLEEKIMADIKAAMIAKEKDKLEALRSIKSAILLVKTGKGGSADLSQDQELAILQKLVKQRKESADIYKQQGRTDLYEREEFEAGIIGEYLPAQISDEELDQALSEIIKKVGASGMADMGKVMGLATKELAGKADGKRISGRVRSMLS